MERRLSAADPLHVVYTINRDFLSIAMVSLRSVASSQVTPCVFHLVYDSDLDARDLLQIQQFVAQLKTSVHFHRVPAAFPRQFAEHSEWDVSVLFRLALAEILPESLSRVLYLDADTLVRRPLDSLRQINLDPSGLGAVAETHDATVRLGLPPQSAYLNSGVLLIDLQTWRQQETSSQMLRRLMAEPDRWHFPDQDILAVQFADGWTRLPPEYNITHRFFQGGNPLPLPTDDPFIIHFTGQGSKPWQTHRQHPFADAFWSAAEAVRQAGFSLPDRPIKPRRWYQHGPIAAYRNRRRRLRSERREVEQASRRQRRESIRQRDRELVARHVPDMVVRRGPFAGMRYPQAYSHGSTLAAKLLGTYEAELQPTIERLLEKDYPLIVDVGGAEGYYAIGCAMRWPDADVIAYELGLEAREAIAEMSAANGVARQIEIQAECVFGDLYGRRGLVICDIEGCEADLLVHKESSKAFADCDFLIETHDLFRPGVCATLADQFSKTHDVTVINAILDDERPAIWSLPELSSLDQGEQSEVIGERRAGPMQWLVCESKNEFAKRAHPSMRAA